MKFKLPTVSSKKPSRRVLLTILASAIVLVLLVVSLAAYERHIQNVAKEQAVSREASIKAENDRKAKEQAVQAQLSDLTAEKQVLCSYAKSLNTAPATKRLTTLPVTAHCL